jgi:hypothetical protein
VGAGVLGLLCHDLEVKKTISEQKDPSCACLFICFHALVHLCCVILGVVMFDVISYFVENYCLGLLFDVMRTFVIISFVFVFGLSCAGYCLIGTCPLLPLMYLNLCADIDILM